MAINPLYGYDTALYGYGQANQPGGTNKRKMPAWMEDINARGIGTAQEPITSMPGFIDIPRGNGLGGFNDQSAAPVSAAAPLVNDSGAQAYGGEGNGAVGDISSNVSNQPAPGYLADVLGALGLSTGTYGGSGGSGTYGGFSPSTPTNEMPNELGGSIGGYGGGTNAVGGDISGSAPGDFAGQMGDLAGMAHGGVVTANKLRGPNPPGPDDGLVPMDLGEGVLTAAAMKHYGPAFLARLNKLQVPKGR